MVALSRHWMDIKPESNQVRFSIDTLVVSNVSDDVDTETVCFGHQVFTSLADSRD